MTLGERITSLRTKQGLSQEALADALGVTRQSVSKWETNASTPELEKLQSLARVFSISLDELVTGQPFTPPEPPQPKVVVVEKQTPPRIMAGMILLGLAVLCFIVPSILTYVAAPPLLVAGVTCLAAKRHPALWSAWGAGLMIDLYIRYGTHLTWRHILLTPVWTPEMNYMRLIVAWIQFLMMLGLLIAAIRVLRKEPLREGSFRRFLLAAAAVVLWAVLLYMLDHFFLTDDLLWDNYTLHYLYRICKIPLDWGSMAVTVLGVQLLLQRRKQPAE